MGRWYYRALVGMMLAGVAAWYTLGIVLVVPALDTLELSKRSESLLRGAAWALLALAIYVNVAWFVKRRVRKVPLDARLSDGEWRSDVLLRLALATAITNVLIMLIFVNHEPDSSWFEFEIADRRLLTRTSPFEFLLVPLALAPLFLALVLFAAIGRARGNAIKHRSL